MIRKTLLAAALVAASAPAAFAGTGTAEFFATINSNGTILRGSGVTSSSRLALGSYAVNFPRAVNTCNMTATAKSDDAHFATVQATAANVNRALVKIWRGTTARDVSFNLLIKCQD